MQQRLYEGEWHEHLREGALLASDFQVGMLVRDMEDNRMFQPIDLPSQERQKMLIYIDLRDAYHALYDYEPEHKVANESLNCTTVSYVSTDISTTARTTSRS